MRNVFKILIRNSEVKRRLGRYRPTWKNNIKMELGEVRFSTS